MKQDGRKKDARWHRLDNTANLFPVITSKRFSNVYRLSINLSAPVKGEILQQAVEDVLPWFAALRVRMRRGLFWRYLEFNPATPMVQEEDDFPCRYIDPAQNNQYLFKVSYYDTRVNLEVFHAITDGTGGMQFLQAVCCRYLLLAHPDAFRPEDKERHWFAEHGEDTEDSYVSNYVPTKKSTFREGRGYKLKGERDYVDSLGVIHIYTPVPELLAACRKRGVSITQYITACIGWAVYTEQLKKQPPKHPVNILLPVNLRNMFPSNTTLNFFSNVYIRLDYKQEELTFEKLLEEVKHQFEEKVTREAMMEKISYTVGSGYSVPIRIVPLPIKNIALRVLFEASVKTSSLSFSSLGKVSFPEVFSPYITGCHVLLSTAPREPLKCTAASYGDTFTISFTSLLHSTAIQRAVVRQLTAEGLEVAIETNGVNNENL